MKIENCVKVTFHSGIVRYFDWFGPFKSGLARAQQDDKWGFLNEKGEIIGSIEYDYVWDFCNGYARVKKDGKYGYVNKLGEVIGKIEYDCVSDFYAGIAKVGKDGQFYFLRENGELVNFNLNGNDIYSIAGQIQNFYNK